MVRTLVAFVSSAQDELHNERAGCAHALKTFGVDARLFESSGAKPMSASRSWEADLRQSHVYIGIFWNGYSEATEREFRLAVDLDLPRFIYEKTKLVHGRDPRLQALLDEIRHGEHKVGSFEDAIQLVGLVQDDLFAWLVSEATNEHTRERVLVGIDEAQPPRPIEVFEDNVADRLAMERRLKETMSEACQSPTGQPFLLVRSLPIFITRPWDMQVRRQRSLFEEEPAALQEILHLLEARYELWATLTAESSVYLIVDQESHEAYFKAGLAGRTIFRPDEVRRQIERWTQLMRVTENFNVGLRSEPVSTEFMLAGSRSLLIYGDVRPADPAMSRTGIRAMAIRDKPTVLKFRLSFDKQWEALTEAAKNRQRTLDWLSGFA